MFPPSPDRRLFFRAYIEYNYQKAPPVRETRDSEREARGRGENVVWKEGRGIKPPPPGINAPTPLAAEFASEYSCIGKNQGISRAGRKTWRRKTGSF